jgi:hypothetical protein
VRSEESERGTSVSFIEAIMTSMRTLIIIYNDLNEELYVATVGITAMGCLHLGRRNVEDCIFPRRLLLFPIGLGLQHG